MEGNVGRLETRNRETNRERDRERERKRERERESATGGNKFNFVSDFWQDR